MADIKMSAAAKSLPAKGRSEQRPMQHGINAVLAMRTGLAEIHRKGAIAKHCVKWHPQEHGVVAVGRDYLPGKFAARCHWG